jgi:hypothetical protein
MNSIRRSQPYIVLLLALLVSSSIFAKEHFPKGCRPLAIKNETLVLSANQPSLTMIHNISDSDVWVTHLNQKGTASAGWSSRLQSSQWSALIHDKHTFKINCIESKPGHEQQVSCAEAIAVCQWKITKLPEKASGTFWAGENKPLFELIAYIERRGFEFSTLGNTLQ